jgi:hypothetical protein
MTIDEQVRHDLFSGLQAAVGLEPAKLMMTAVPPFSWNEIATKADLAKFATRDEMRAEFAAVRSEMKFEFAAIRGEMSSEFAAVRGEMSAEFAKVRSEMHANTSAIRLEMANSTNSMLAQLVKMQWNMLFQIATINISTAGIVIAALHFLR